jgi:hypothetical protein
MPRRRAAAPNPPITLWGWDIYIVAFAAIGGAFVCLGIFWLFFTHWPIPRYCGTRRTSYICGWVQRSSTWETSRRPVFRGT